MNVKIYFNNKPLFLTDTIDNELAAFIHHDDAVFIDELSTPGVNSMIHEMRQEKVHVGIYYHKNLEELKKAFLKKFVLVKAAGGLVRNEKNELLVMFRRNKWDLPKGKLDPGESLEECALREVKEETGIQKLQLIKPLVVTYHTYDESGKHILKETHWFAMKTKSNERLVPQTGEDITEVRWAHTDEIPKLLKNSFASMHDVTAAGLNPA